MTDATPGPAVQTDAAIVANDTTDPAATVAANESHAPPLVVQKLMHDGARSYRWEGREIHRDDDHLFFTAVFERQGRDLGYVRFEKGDVFYEWYYFDRWYNVFQVYSEAGDLKGWYCNVTAPARVDGGELTFVDLALDLWVWPDMRYLVLDEDEFDELAASAYTPEQVAEARASLAELIQRTEAGTLPSRPFVGPVPPPGPTGG
jgi:protein associated with RNAse G/E